MDQDDGEAGTKEPKDHSFRLFSNLKMQCIGSCVCSISKSAVKHHFHNRLFGNFAGKKPFLKASQ